jgi:hypothetical protein
MNNALLNTKQIADKTGFLPQKIRYLIHRGVIPAFKIGESTREHFIFENDLDNFLISLKDNK